MFKPDGLSLKRWPIPYYFSKVRYQPQSSGADDCAEIISTGLLQITQELQFCNVHMTTRKDWESVFPF